jgi:hypothetical protein
MSQQTEKITHIVLNGQNYLSWVHIVTIGLGGISKLQYVTGGQPKPVAINPNFLTAQEKSLKRMKSR